MVNNIEKRIVVASADPLSHMELELTSAIQDAYEKAVKEGFIGTITDWIKTAPIDEVKKINLAGGGPVKNRPKEPKVKKLNIADYFELGRTVASLSPMEREVVSTLVKKMLRPGNPQDN
jgi:hypothetical protein|tara:strand:+ start:1093 stop:1449 length:357 start_codon:yes stop_codon:yes gene_type:complete